MSKSEVPIPDFTGESAESGAAYLRRFERIAKYNAWKPDEQHIHFIRKMQGKAASWLGKISETVLDDWPQLKAAFIQQFAERTKSDAGIKIKELRQYPGESVEKYADMFRDLCIQADLDVTSPLARELFIAGLVNDVQVTTLAHADKPFEDLVRYAASVDNILHRRPRPTNDRPTYEQKPRFTPKYERQEETTTRIFKAEGSKYCTFCRRPGHNIEECRTYTRTQGTPTAPIMIKEEHTRQTAQMQAPTKQAAAAAPTVPAQAQPQRPYELRERRPVVGVVKEQENENLGSARTQPVPK